MRVEIVAYRMLRKRTKRMKKMASESFFSSACVASSSISGTFVDSFRDLKASVKLRIRFDAYIKGSDRLCKDMSTGSSTLS